MTPEDIAARYNKLPGFRLADYHSVALPLWLITFDALVISEKKHPVVDEFLLRAIERGVATVAELAGFLGLSEKLILRRLGTLVGSDLIVSKPGPDRTSATLSLTPKGINVVRDVAKTPPRREKLVLAYDAIARQPITGRIAREAMRTPQQIKQFGLFELPALPGRAPDDTELARIDYNTALPKETRKDQKIHQVLSAQKVGTVARRYREGLMLIYRGATDLEQVAVRFFSIDGRPMPEVDRGFQQNRGLQRLAIIEQLKKHRAELEKELMDDSDYRAVVEFSSKHVPASDVSDNIAQSAKLESAIQEKQKQIEESKQPPSEVNALKEEIEKLRADKAAAEALISQNQSRLLEPQEHPKLFENALKEVKRRLLIISPWISDRVMEPKVRFIEAALKRGVEIYIGYGISDRENDERKARQGDLTIDWLIETARLYPKLHVVKLGDTHAKVLLMDDRFVVVGSFNWMSFGGLPSYENGVQVFREELSTLNTAPAMIEQMFQRYLARFTKYLGGGPKESPPKPAAPLLPPEQPPPQKAPKVAPPPPKPDQKKQAAPQQSTKPMGLTPKMISEHLGKKPFVVIATAMEQKIFPTLNAVLSDDVIRAVYKDLKASLPTQPDLDALRAGKYRRKEDEPKI